MAIISYDFGEGFCVNNDNRCMPVFSSIGLALRCTALLKTKCGNALKPLTVLLVLPTRFPGDLYRAE